MKKKILIIEDDTIVRQNTAEILQLANYMVQTAENGKVGLEKAGTFKPDLIICDILMPELDGYGVMQIIMRNKALQKTPVIFMSAKTKHEDVRRGMDLGASDYITKPFEESELLSAVATRLKRKEMMEHADLTMPGTGRRWRIEEFERAFESKEVITLKPGATIFSEGNVGHYVYYILKGAVKTFKINEEGKELITEIFSEKSFFGFTSFLENKLYVENAEALKPTSLIRIRKKELLNMIRSDPQLGLNFLDLLSHDLEHIKEHLMHLAYDSVRRKTADAIVQLQSKGEKSSIEISRSDLASFLGIAKETLTRTLTDFKEEELIDTIKNKIKVLDKEKLMHIK